MTELGSGFLNIINTSKPKINKWGLIELTGFYIAKETISKLKKQISE